MHCQNSPSMIAALGEERKVHRTKEESWDEEEVLSEQGELWRIQFKPEELLSLEEKLCLGPAQKKR